MTMTRDSTPGADRIFEESAFAALPGEVRRQLRGELSMVAFEPGEIIYDQGKPGWLFLVLGGLLRLYVKAPDGRAATTGYLGPGDLTCLLTLMGPAPVTIQAMAPTRAARLPRDRVLELARAYPGFTMRLGDELHRHWTATLGTLATNTFGTVRQRTIVHLLALAQYDAANGCFVVRSTHEGLANAVGSVQRVVGRELRELARSGLIELKRGNVVLLDPAALHAEVADLKLS